MDVESPERGRNKKLIWALEAHERHGQPNCNTCSEKMRTLRGCGKQGMEKQQPKAYRFSSPLLAEKHLVVYECPVGAILRNFPFAYEVINACSFLDRSGVSGLACPPFLDSAHSIVSSEKMRLERIRQQDKQTSRDANYAKRVLKARQ